MIDYEIDDRRPCPECQNNYTHYRRCDCDQGWLDAFDDDPINYVEGEYFVRCPKCSGSGFDMWCPSCGTALSDRTLEESV